MKLASSICLLGLVISISAEFVTYLVPSKPQRFNPYPAGTKSDKPLPLVVVESCQPAHPCSLTRVCTVG